MGCFQKEKTSPEKTSMEKISPEKTLIEKISPDRSDDELSDNFASTGPSNAAVEGLRM